MKGTLSAKATSVVEWDRATKPTLLVTAYEWSSSMSLIVAVDQATDSAPYPHPDVHREFPRVHNFRSKSRLGLYEMQLVRPRYLKQMALMHPRCG